MKNNTQQKSATFTFANQTLLLLPQKAVFWQEEKALWVSDLHLGKAAHFRKSGIPIPSDVHRAELLLLEEIIFQYQPKKVLFLGDLFHSDWNQEWLLFSHWIKSFPKQQFFLLKGNHDILPLHQYTSLNIQVAEILHFPPFTFSHEVSHEVSHEGMHDAPYNISGHVHPGISLKGAAKQRLTLPCFYFGKDYGLMPAFGKFTGLAKIKLFAGDHVFAIADNTVFNIPT